MRCRQPSRHSRAMTAESAAVDTLTPRLRRDPLHVPGTRYLSPHRLLNPFGQPPSISKGRKIRLSPVPAENGDGSNIPALLQNASRRSWRRALTAGPRTAFTRGPGEFQLISRVLIVIAAIGLPGRGRGRAAARGLRQAAEPGAGDPVAVGRARRLRRRDAGRSGPSRPRRRRASPWSAPRSATSRYAASGWAGDDGMVMID